MTKVMFEKWQHEREHQKLSWLRCERERDKRHLVSLHCAVCKKYKRSIESLKNFFDGLHNWFGESNGERRAGPHY